VRVVTVLTQFDSRSLLYLGTGALPTTLDKARGFHTFSITPAARLRPLNVAGGDGQCHLIIMAIAFLISHEWDSILVIWIKKFYYHK
jgi:hypothetical protein